ncbi:monocarboxylate transporter 12-like [Saccostrea echinata]|uniref:monocarboxylate transporter 12-like n=1 Tax=Saccostrea echinata TaxID=191078 RepID=UPI002A7EC8A4|nr:monocarboxylate transporter 12-like [Saccostrea echinata]
MAYECEGNNEELSPSKRDHDPVNVPEQDGATDVDPEVRQNPTDHGYAWVILAASMVATFIITGTFRAFGVLYVELILTFNSNATMASLVQGLLIFTSSTGSVLVLVFGLRRFSPRFWVVLGGFFYFFGFLTSSYAVSIEFLLFSYSCLTGFGMAFSFSSIVVTVGNYFDKKRGFANGLMMASGSLGSLVFAPFLRLLLDEYSVRGSLLIVAAISTHIIACGALLRPPSFATRINDKCRAMIAQNAHKEEKGKLILNRDNVCRTNKPLFSSDPSLFLQNGMFKPFEPQTKSISTEMIHKTKHFDLNSEIKDKKVVKINKEQFFNFKILKNASFLRLLFAYTVGSIGTSLPQNYLPALAMEEGTEATNAALLITVSSFFDLLGRIMIGYVSDKRLVRRSYLIAVSMALSGVVQCLSPFYKDYWNLVLFSAFYGFFSNFISALYSATLLDILGLDDFRSALSVMYSGYGIMSGAAAPFIGDLRDKTGTYVTCFYLFGAAHILSSIVLFTECVSCS